MISPFKKCRTPKYLLLLSFAVLLLSVTSAQALEITKVYTLPENVSAGHPYLFVAETTALPEGSSRVSWIVTAPGTSTGGSFNKISSTKWFCYLSDKETTNCGPIIFDTASSGVVFDVVAESPSESKGSQFIFNSGELKFIEKDFTVDNNNTVFIGLNIDGNVQGDVKYTIYDNKLVVVKSGKMDYLPQTSINYKLNTQLSAGEYYIVLEADSTDKGSGGYVYYVKVGGQVFSSELNIPSIKETTSKNLGEPYQKTIKIENPTDKIFSNLSVEVPQELRSLIKATLDKQDLAANGEVNLEFKIENLRTSLFLDNFLELYAGTNKTLVGKVPVKLSINLLGQASGGGPLASLSPSYWLTEGQPLASDTLTKTFSVTNIGNADLSVSSYSLENLPNDSVKVTLPSGAISPGSSSDISVELKPTQAGLFTGKIKLATNGGDKEIEVNIKVFSNLANQIQSLKTEVQDKEDDLLKKGYVKEQLDDIFSSIKSDLDQAQQDYNRGDHDSARISFAIAQGKFSSVDDLLKLPTAGSGGGTGLLLPILVLIILLAVGFLLYKKKFSKKKKKDEFEEEFENEEFEEEK